MQHCSFKKGRIVLKEGCFVYHKVNYLQDLRVVTNYTGGKTWESTEKLSVDRHSFCEIWTFSRRSSILSEHYIVL